MVTVANDEIPEIPMNKHRTNNTEQTLQIITINNLSLKHNQITRIQTQKHSFKINQIITIKAKKKKKKRTKDRSLLTHLDWVEDEDEQ